MDTPSGKMAAALASCRVFCEQKYWANHTELKKVAFDLLVNGRKRRRNYVHQIMHHQRECVQYCVCQQAKALCHTMKPCQWVDWNVWRVRATNNPIRVGRQIVVWQRIALYVTKDYTEQYHRLPLHIFIRAAKTYLYWMIRSAWMPTDMLASTRHWKNVTWQWTWICLQSIVWMLTEQMQGSRLYMIIVIKPFAGVSLTSHSVGITCHFESLISKWCSTLSRGM